MNSYFFLLLALQLIGMAIALGIAFYDRPAFIIAITLAVLAIITSILISAVFIRKGIDNLRR